MILLEHTTVDVQNCVLVQELVVGEDVIRLRAKHRFALAPSDESKRALALRV